MSEYLASPELWAKLQSVGITPHRWDSDGRWTCLGCGYTTVAEDCDCDCHEEDA